MSRPLLKDPPRVSRDSYAVLAAFVLSVLAAGLAIGYSNPPGAWYASLSKPWFNPPNWVFAPAWSVLYLLIAIAGWRTWANNPRSLAMGLWCVQMALNFLWSPTFFSAHSLAGALAIILLLLAAIVAFIAVQWREDRVASALFMPYAGWVAFATALNFAILHLN